MTEQAREPEPPLSEGHGLTFDEIRKLLAEKHDVAVSKDETLLILVSILNVYLGEFETQHQRHNAALAKIIAARTSEYIDGVRATTEGLTKTLSEASVEGIRKIFDDHAGRLQSLRASLFWCSALITLSALINAVFYLLK